MGNGQKIAGFVLGIVGLIISVIPIVSLFGLPMAIVGLVLSVLGNKKERSGLGTAAFVISLIAVVFSGITFFTCGLCVLLAAA